MKLQLILLKAFFILTIYGANAQGIKVCPEGLTGKGEVKIFAEPLLDQFTAPVPVPNDEEVKMPGFRVQIYQGTDREAATKVRTQVMQQYSNEPAYLSYEAPYFKIRVGDYRNRLEAQKMLNLLKSQYTGVLLVPDKINFPTLKR